jgi:hypothetical protein
MMTPAQRGAQTRKLNALIDAYSEKFPGWSGIVTPEVQRAMSTALKTGIDQPIMIRERKRITRRAAAHDAKVAAEHARPFTPDLEKHYTARIKNRRIIEGDCERPWQNYFDYRAAHPKDVAPLDAKDLAYVGQWTACVFDKLTD